MPSLSGTYGYKKVKRRKPKTVARIATGEDQARHKVFPDEHLAGHLPLAGSIREYKAERKTTRQKKKARRVAKRVFLKVSPHLSSAPRKMPRLELNAKLEDGLRGTALQRSPSRRPRRDVRGKGKVSIGPAPTRALAGKSEGEPKKDKQRAKQLLAHEWVHLDQNYRPGRPRWSSEGMAVLKSRKIAKKYGWEHMKESKDYLAFAKRERDRQGRFR
jgi:hypothetical protein